MATIGSLAVNITAVTSGFSKGIASAQSQLSKFTKGIGGLNAVIGGLSIYGMGRLIKSSLDTADALGDTAANLRINVEELQKLDFATKQLGGSTQALHTGMSMMQRVLGQVAQGSESAAKKFDRLGLSTEQLLSMPVDQQFRAIVDAINKLPNAAEKAAASQDIFGRGAKDLASVIDAGTGKLNALGTELERVNGILSKDQVEAAQKAKDAIDKLGAAWEAMKNKAVAAMAPEIETAAEVGVDTLGGAGRLFGGAMRGATIAAQGMNRLIGGAKGAMGMDTQYEKVMAEELRRVRISLEQRLGMTELAPADVR